MLSGDIGNRLFDKFKRRAPGRFFNCGVAEANMMGVAAGMAMSGLRPVTYTITPFVTTRCLEQIRTDVCYHDVPVTIVVAVGAGLSYAGLGPTHHACEDIAFLRALPNMVVICPGDAFEVRAALRACVAAGPPGLYSHGQARRTGSAQRCASGIRDRPALMVEDGSDVCLLSTGNMLPEVQRRRGHVARTAASQHAGRELPHRQAAR